MRRKRQLLVYEPDVPCSKKEAAEAIKTAEEFIGVIFKIIKRKNPQMELEL
jgi:HEPN domain-containing protein